MVSFAISVPHAAPSLDPAASAATWSQAAPLDLHWDVVQRRNATEPTTVRIATDGTNIYVRFDATQHEPVAATERSNDVGQGTDDAVWVDLWPNGNSGYYYQFQATPNGTHYESSSENTSYQPVWQSYGAIRADGYTTILKIPLSVLHGVHSGTWKAQFVRLVHATGEQQVWSYDSAQILPDDVARAGAFTIPLATKAPRPQPRIASYVLGEGASRSIGGNTARTGADLSVPITPTASFYATLHPDFSNVELDQQSISPSVFQRQFNEVRPFFTQAAGLYNKLYYFATNAPIQALYTPAIPTPRDGYAFEGKQGLFSFGGFDSISDGSRSDTASVLDYATSDNRWEGGLQRTSVNAPSLLDTVTDATLRYNDLKHASVYATYGHDAGTNVANATDAQWYDAGGDWQSKTFVLFGGVRKVGDFYNPVDGFTFHPGIAGYALYSVKQYTFTGNSTFVQAGVAAMIDRYQGITQGQAQSDNQLIFDALTKSGLDFQLLSGSNYWRFGNTLTPISQNAGFSFTYHSGIEATPPSFFPSHGNAPTPTTITYNTGHYGTGKLDTWFRTSTIRAGNRGTITLAVDDTAQWFTPTTRANVQWFDSLAYTDQVSADSSFAIGLRKVTGTPPTPNGGGNCIGTCTNVSFAYRYRTKHGELYLTYGNPNTLTTTPQAIVKFILYTGADKGA